MEPLMVNYGVELGIYSRKTNGFLRYEVESRKVKADSVHPFLKVTQAKSRPTVGTATKSATKNSEYLTKEILQQKVW